MHDNEQICENFPDEQLFSVSTVPWFADFANYCAMEVIPNDFDPQGKKRFLAQCRYYYWDDPYFFKLGKDDILEGAYQRMSRKVYFLSVMSCSVEVTLVARKPH